MKSITRRVLSLLEEGTALAELEGRLLGAPRREHTMTIDNQPQEDAHFAPVEAWDAIAASYDAHVTSGEATLATEALKLAGLSAGDRFLDVAAGTGGLSLPAARMGARVLATDWSRQMIDHLRARIRKDDIGNVEAIVMDCHALDVPSDTYDVTGSLFGVMLVPDQELALREMVRVTKPGGRVLLIAYAAPSKFEALQVFIGGLRAVNPDFPGLPSDPPPLDFQVSDPEVMRRRLEAAGLRDVRVDTAHQEELALTTGQQLWDWCLGSNPIPGMLVSELTDAQQRSMRQHMDDTVRSRTNGNRPARLTAPLNIGIGTK